MPKPNDAMPPTPQPVDDLDADLRAARDKQQMQNVAMRAIQRCKQWQRYENDRALREQPGKTVQP